ncbi:hypothetical protein BJX99DRAFT_228808 [Aspergillus californicus]
MARLLEKSLLPWRNLLIFDDSGAILGGLPIRQESPYISSTMLYRYCDIIFDFPEDSQRAIFHMRSDGSTGDLLPPKCRKMVTPGNYIILDQDKSGISVTPSLDDTAPRGYSRSPSSQMLEYEQPRVRLSPQISHRYKWKANGYRDWISDARDPALIGSTGLYSPQNGRVRHLWDVYVYAVDPDEDFKVICFDDEDEEQLGGRHLDPNTYNASDANNRVSRDLRWQLRMCLLKKMEGNPDYEEREYDLDPDDDIGDMLPAYRPEPARG